MPGRGITSDGDQTPFAVMAAPSVTSGHPDGDIGCKALLGSLVVHAALMAVLVFIRSGPLPHPAPEETVAVSMVTQREFRAVAQPDVTPAAASLKSSAMPDTSAKPSTFERLTKERDQSAGMIKATRFLSARVLNDPKSAKARKAMGELAPSERIIQLCNVEAMAQIHAASAAFQPDFVVAYAMAEMKLGDHSLEAEGGAFRSKRRWYGIVFHCTVSPDNQVVTSFAFKIGNAIPEAEWANHQLAADDGSLD